MTFVGSLYQSVYSSCHLCLQAYTYPPTCTYICVPINTCMSRYQPSYLPIPCVQHVHRRMRRGAGGAAALPNSGKQWGKFGQTVGEIRAKQEEKIGQRKLKDYQINNVQGGCLWNVFTPPSGNCYLCKISGKSTPLPP